MTLIYLGPSLEKEVAQAICPEALILPPAKQGDIVSDLHIHNPKYVILIDGEFQQSLSPWHKELVFALQYSGVKGVYGASSMGALRAADLHMVGMVGFGKIFDWYKSGLITDDAEVAVAYSEDYSNQTIPLVNIRATPIDDTGWFAKAKAIHYASRTSRALESVIRGLHGPICWTNQKRIDAIGLLENYKSLSAPSTVTADHLSHLFHAQNERDRQVLVNGHKVALQHIDAHACLTSPNISEELWNSNNRQLALILAEQLNITVSDAQLKDEVDRCVKRGLQFNVNNLTPKEAFAVLKENAKIRQLHKALDSTRMRRRNTKPLLDHLRTWGRYAHYASTTPVDDKVDLEVQDFNTPVLNTESTLEDYISECGFSTMAELCAAIKIERNK